MGIKGWWDRLCAVKYGPWLLAVLCLMVLGSLLLSGQEAGTGGASHEEARIARVLSRIAGAGEVEVALYYAQSESASLLEKSAQASPLVGAVIVAQGGGEIGVRLQLIRAASTLLGLRGDQICVFPMDQPAER